MKTVIKHWQDPINAVVGAWLILAPWAVGFQAETAAMANSVIVGLALLAFALATIFKPRAWEEWFELVLGLWLIASPWVLGFSALATATNATVVAGLVVAVLAFWVLMADKDYSGWLRKAQQ